MSSIDLQPIIEMKAKRRRHDGAFKARVTLEAMRIEKTIHEIAEENDVHPTQATEANAGEKSVSLMNGHHIHSDAARARLPLRRDGRCTRDVPGWAVYNRMDETLTDGALENAVG
jgi:hypothetical protein